MGMARNTRKRGREQVGMSREGRRTMEKVLENTVRDNTVYLLEYKEKGNLSSSSNDVKVSLILIPADIY